jgi:hypothetical protein
MIRQGMMVQSQTPQQHGSLNSQGHQFSSMQHPHPSQSSTQQPPSSQSGPPGPQSHMVIPSQPTGPQNPSAARPGMGLGSPFGVPGVSNVTMNMGMGMQPPMNMQVPTLPSSTGSSPNRQPISPHSGVPGARNVNTGAGGSATATPSMQHNTPSQMQNTPGAANAPTPGRGLPPTSMNSGVTKPPTPSNAQTPYNGMFPVYVFRKFST